MDGAGLTVRVSAGLAGSTARLPRNLHARKCLPAGAWPCYSPDACRESCRPANQCSDEWDAARSRLRNWDRRCGVLGQRTFRKTCIQTNKCGQQVNSEAAQCCNVHMTVATQASEILLPFLGTFACVPELSKDQRNSSSDCRQPLRGTGRPSQQLGGAAKVSSPAPSKDSLHFLMAR